MENVPNSFRAFYSMFKLYTDVFHYMKQNKTNKTEHNKQKKIIKDKYQISVMFQSYECGSLGKCKMTI